MRETVQDVGCNGASLRTILGQPAAPGPRSQALFAHQPSDPVQATALSKRGHVVPDPARSIGTVAIQKALVHRAPSTSSARRRRLGGRFSHA